MTFYLNVKIDMICKKNMVPLYGGLCPVLILFKNKFTEMLVVWPFEQFIQTILARRKYGHTDAVPSHVFQLLSCMKITFDIKTMELASVPRVR